MSIFRKKETVSIYKKECKRLKEERNRLLDELNAAQRYKEDYESLIGEVIQLKTKFNALVSKTEAINNEYKKKLEEQLTR